MAVTQVRTDDITGASGDDVVERSFAVDGKRYVIDMGTDSWEQFTQDLAQYIESARPDNTPQGSARKSPKASGGSAKKSSGGSAKKSSGASLESDAIRAYAHANGIKVSDRGRISNEARQAWESAGRPGAPAATDAPAEA